MRVCIQEQLKHECNRRVQWKEKVEKHLSYETKQCVRNRKRS